ncbi:AGAP004386-PA-like protein [Anopheles sinensis]|uniref:AGAP004386-PA-like protein n=1 Tax=Anopheles sinensis TaxID=74873 RepID=A0A084W3F6_ANOSI|nr:AGAP004386-PA-like protein [Anopheles sinensis]
MAFFRFFLFSLAAGGTPVNGHGGHGILLDEEGYWGSPCSSSESQPDPTHRDRYSTPPPPQPLPSAAMTQTTLGLAGSTGGGVLVRPGLRHIPAASIQPADQSSSYSSVASCSSSSSSSSSSASPSTSSSPYGGHPNAGYHHQPRHLAHDGQHQPHQHQHHHQHQQTPPSMVQYMVYDKGTAYIPDEGYYGGGNGTSLDIVSGTGGEDHSAHLQVTQSSSGVIPGNGLPVVRVVKRRNTANKKERRRTQSINSAYSSLRDRIPNVPNDTKLSKIKTLRLAISYIAHLLAVVNGNQDPSCDFRAELVPSSRKINAERRAQKTLMQNLSTNGDVSSGARKVKGRTGWPQHVWALETKTTIK